MLTFSPEVELVLSKLNKFGKGYIVGGAVRDILMGNFPMDYDFATNIPQKTILEVFKKYSPKIINSKYQITQFNINNISFEIARMRIEKGTLDHRNPKTTSFVDEIKQDLKRRDFTINAMAYNHKEGLIDIYGGRKDIDKKLIRTVGKPSLRLYEDYTRIIRAFKYQAKLGFNIDYILLKEIIKLTSTVKLSSIKYKVSDIEVILFSKYSYKTIELFIKHKIAKFLFFQLSYTDNTRNISDFCENYKYICNRNMYEEKLIVTLFLMKSLLKINQNYLKLSSTVYVKKLLQSFKFPIKYIQEVIENLKFYNLIEKKPNFNTPQTVKEVLPYINSHSLNLNNVYWVYEIINRKYEKKYIKKLKYIIQKMMQKYISLEDLELQYSDIYNSKLNNYNKSFDIRHHVQEMVCNGKIKNDKYDILKYLFNKFKIPFDLCYEMCAGAIVYDKISINPNILVVKIKKGNWGFAKGHIESGENTKQTAIREVKEETNLDVTLKYTDKYVRQIKYVIYNQCLKIIHYYLSLANHTNVVIDKNEIDSYEWCTLKKAYNKISYRSQQDILLSSYIYLYATKEIKK